MSYQIRCTWAAQHKMILRCTVWCFGKHSDVDPILDRKTILRWSRFDSFEKRAPGPNLGPASTNRDLRLYPEVCFSCIVTNLHLSVI